MGNKVQFGICNLVFAEMITDGTATTAPTYSTDLIEVPGTVKITVEYDSKENDFAADNNAKYWMQHSNSGNSGEVEVALIPDELLAAAHGWRVDSNGGLVEVANGVQKKFAMGYQVEGDEAGRRIWHYNVALGFPSEEHNTAGEDVTPDTQTIEWTGAQVTCKGEDVYRYSLVKSTANATVYGSFLASVTLPAEAGA